MLGECEVESSPNAVLGNLTLKQVFSTATLSLKPEPLEAVHWHWASADMIGNCGLRP